MSKLEQVARAMQASKAWPAVFDAGSAEELARAALSAIREPDEGMVERIASDDDELSDALHAELRKQRAWSIEKYGQVALATYPFAKIVAARLWTAMIDHILSETKP